MKTQKYMLLIQCFYVSNALHNCCCSTGKEKLNKNKFKKVCYVIYTFYPFSDMFLIMGLLPDLIIILED